MIIKYAVLSSDNNPEYLNYWPYTAAMWNRIGIKPFLFYINETTPDIDLEKYGIIHHIKPIDWDISQQAQCIRFWAAKLLNDPFIISDIDMFPISGDYYKDGANRIDDKLIVSYSSDIIQYGWYSTNPQYPMCYLAGSCESFQNLLELNDDTPQKFLYRMKSLKIPYGTDQRYFFKQSKKIPWSIKHLERGWIDGKYARLRLENSTWPKSEYNIEEYIDCHLPKFSIDNMRKLDEILLKLNITKQCH